MRPVWWPCVSLLLSLRSSYCLSPAPMLLHSASSPSESPLCFLWRRTRVSGFLDEPWDCCGFCCPSVWKNRTCAEVRHPAASREAVGGVDTGPWPCGHVAQLCSVYGRVHPQSPSMRFCTSFVFVEIHEMGPSLELGLCNPD